MRGKKCKGRKRHVLVDTLGLLWAVVVHPADIQDAAGAQQVLMRARSAVKRLKIIWVDAAYRAVVDWAWIRWLWTLEVVHKTADTGFHVLPKRWIVERSFGWLNRYRRLSKDYERTTPSSEALIYIAMIHVMIRRLRT
jgi:putative transposase